MIESTRWKASETVAVSALAIWLTEACASLRAATSAAASSSATPAASTTTTTAAATRFTLCGYCDGYQRQQCKTKLTSVS